MSMKKPILFSALLLALAAALIVPGASAAGRKDDTPTGLSLVAEQSFFHEFSVEGETVRMRCQITVVNGTEKAQRFVIRASSPGDVRHGLLKTAGLFVRDGDGNERVFLLDARGTMLYETVIFEGAYGGVPEKTNRLLPDIRIETVPPVQEGKK